MKTITRKVRSECFVDKTYYEDHSGQMHEFASDCEAADAKYNARDAIRQLKLTTVYEVHTLEVEDRLLEYIKPKSVEEIQCFLDEHNLYINPNGYVWPYSSYQSISVDDGYWHDVP